MRAARNYRTLVLAGLGSVGRSLVRLGSGVIGGFEACLGLDREDRRDVLGDVGEFVRGDVTEPSCLTRVLESAPRPVLWVNLCPGLDNTALRGTLAPWDVAYLDSCAASLPDEVRFSRLMPHTLRSVGERRPHWVCWGINPGLVEIVARDLLRNVPSGTAPEVSVYERDQLRATLSDGKLAVGWSPEVLVEEVMRSPVLEVVGGVAVEETQSGSVPVLTSWEGEEVSSRMVAHEDIWNLGMLGGVARSRFFYSLEPAVMEAFMGEPVAALRRLEVPGESVAVDGMERVAVMVRGLNGPHRSSRVWETDHAEAWSRHRLNAVQVQTGTSLLLAIRLLQETRYGSLPGTHSASSLPIGSTDWDCITAMMEELGITWADARHLGLDAAVG